MPAQTTVTIHKNKQNAIKVSGLAINQINEIMNRNVKSIIMLLSRISQ